MSKRVDALTRRGLLQAAGTSVAGLILSRRAAAQTAPSTSIINFEERLFAMRMERYRNRKVDLKIGFRPVGGSVADFAVAERGGRYHFFYIERRLQEGTPFYPGHETYFGHASTANFVDWTVHDPVLMVRPDSWEDGHVWAPSILKRGDEYVMAYTGVNRHLSQNIGLASSADLFTWKRWESNPIYPFRGGDWCFWREDRISSCRDPYLVEHDGRIWMTYTANTKEGASCIALASTADLRTWRDHDPIIVGPNTGYEPRLEGGHKQGSLESACPVYRRGRWHLIFKAVIQDKPIRQWILTSDRLTQFDWSTGREFWPDATGVEVVMDKGDRSLLAAFSAGHIRLGVADWSKETPTAMFIQNEQELEEWLK